MLSKAFWHFWKLSGGDRSCVGCPGGTEEASRFHNVLNLKVRCRGGERRRQKAELGRGFWVTG